MGGEKSHFLDVSGVVTCWRTVVCVAAIGMWSPLEADDGLHRLFTVDLSGVVSNQHVVAAGTPTEYQGHPTTAMLADGTVLATTYLKYRNDACRQSVVSVRFKPSETDAMAARAKPNRP